MEYLICGSPRTGGNLLCDLLNQTRKAGKPAEPARALPRGATIPEKNAWVKEIRESMSTPGRFGVLLHRPEWADLFMEEHTKCIFLYRESLVEQAVSCYVAMQTGQWRLYEDGGEAVEPIVFDRDAILCLEQEFLERNVEWEQWFSDFSVAPLCISFEKLADDTELVTRQVLDFLGIEADVPKPRLVRQRNQIYDSMLAKLSKDYA